MKLDFQTGESKVESAELRTPDSNDKKRTKQVVEEKKGFSLMFCFLPPQTGPTMYLVEAVAAKEKYKKKRNCWSSRGRGYR